MSYVVYAHKSGSVKKFETDVEAEAWAEISKGGGTSRVLVHNQQILRSRGDMNDNLCQCVGDAVQCGKLTIYVGQTFKVAWHWDGAAHCKRFPGDKRDDALVEYGLVKGKTDSKAARMIIAPDGSIVRQFGTQSKWGQMCIGKSYAAGELKHQA